MAADLNEFTNALMGIGPGQKKPKKRPGRFRRPGDVDEGKDRAFQAKAERDYTGGRSWGERMTAARKAGPGARVGVSARVNTGAPSFRDNVRDATRNLGRPMGRY